MSTMYFKCWNCAANLPIESNSCRHVLPCGCSYSSLNPTKVQAIWHRMPHWLRAEHLWEASGLDVTCVHPLRELAISGWRDAAILRLQTVNTLGTTPSTENSPDNLSLKDLARSAFPFKKGYRFPDSEEMLQAVSCSEGSVLYVGNPIDAGTVMHASRVVGKVETFQDDGSATVRVGIADGSYKDDDWLDKSRAIVADLNPRRRGWSDYEVWQRTYSLGEYVSATVGRILETLNSSSTTVAQRVNDNTILVQPVKCGTSSW